MPIINTATLKAASKTLSSAIKGTAKATMGNSLANAFSGFSKAVQLYSGVRNMIRQSDYDQMNNGQYY